MAAQIAARRHVHDTTPISEDLQEKGYVVLKNLISQEHVQQIASELEPHFTATPRCEGDFYGWKTTRLGGVLTRAPSTISLAMNETILEMANALLAPYCDYVQLNLVQATRVHPGEEMQVPHRDEEMWPCDKRGIPWLINVMWAISDFTAENGATRLWPSSHAENLDRFIDENASIPGEMPAGSACVFMGALTHGAGGNNSRAPRTGIIVSYCLGWLKTYENQFLTYPPEVAKNFPPALQQLIGYRIHRPNLGGWNGQDPSVLLSDQKGPFPHVDALPPAIAEELRAYYSARAAG